MTLGAHKLKDINFYQISLGLNFIKDNLSLIFQKMYSDNISIMRNLITIFYKIRYLEINLARPLCLHVIASYSFESNAIRFKK